MVKQAKEMCRSTKKLCHIFRCGTYFKKKRTKVCHKDIDVADSHDVDTREHLNEVEGHLQSLVKEISIKDNFKAGLNDIIILVYSMVRFLYFQLNSCQSQFRFDGIISTGSVADGTKIMAPDEFDFLITIDADIQAMVAKACAGGFAHIETTSSNRSKEETYFDDNWKFSVVFRNKFRQLFHYIVARHIGKIFEADNGHLTLKGYSVPINGPQCSVRVLWCPKIGENLEIVVDITPAIKCSKSIESLITADEVDDNIRKLLNENDQVYLVPKPQPCCNRCYKLVFDQADKAMCSSLQEHHRKCLLVLKYLAIQIQNYDFRFRKTFSSFSMKMAMYQHTIHCDKNKPVVDCLASVVCYLLECLKQKNPTLSSVFTPERNIWSNTRICPGIGISDRDIAVDILTTIIDVLKTSADSYDCFIDSIKAACRHIKSMDEKCTIEVH
ncbi:hypothetical protein ACF0H5_009074 [Mactra antiquata]